MTSYDVIGDVHGCADDLAALLDAMGYANDTGVYKHATNKAVFVGDLIDRGSQQLQVLQIVKAMVDAGSALCIMGNHEFNAICYSIRGARGEYLRVHSGKNAHQHRAFRGQLTVTQQREYLKWFRTLPLWLDLGGLRVVHACWHGDSIKVVEQHPDSKWVATEDQFFIDASIEGHPLFEAVEILLKGPEIDLDDNYLPSYRDKDGHPRSKARQRWWSSGATLEDQVEISGSTTTITGDSYPQLPPDKAKGTDYRYRDAVPVIYGHYWRQGAPEIGHDWTERTACVDFSAVKGGQLTAYQWKGEDTINPDHYFRCKDA